MISPQLIPYINPIVAHSQSYSNVNMKTKLLALDFRLKIDKMISVNLESVVVV